MIMMRKCRTSICISQRNTSEGMTQNNVSPIFRYPERVLRMDAERQTYLAGNVLPPPALVKSLMVPSGNQGIPSKLHMNHGETTVTHTTTG